MTKKPLNFLFLGPENGQKAEEILKIRDSLRALHPDLEESKHYAFETSIADFVGDLQNGGLFSSFKMVILASVEELKAADVKILGEYLKNPSPETALILTSDETKLDPLAKFFSKDQTKVFWEMFENQKKGWVIAHFRSIGLTIEPDAAEFFLEMVENSTDQIKLEAQKILAYYDQGALIRLEDLETFLVHSREENVFTLFERVAERDFPGALENLHKILFSKESEGVALLAGLTWQFKNLLHYQVKLLERIPSEEAFLTAGIRGKKAQSTITHGARNYSLREVQEILTLLVDYDTKLRGFRTEYQGLILELFLYAVIQKKGLPLATAVY